MTYFLAKCKSHARGPYSRAFHASQDTICSSTCTKCLKEMRGLMQMDRLMRLANTSRGLFCKDHGVAPSPSPSTRTTFRHSGSKLSHRSNSPLRLLFIGSSARHTCGPGMRQTCKSRKGYQIVMNYHAPMSPLLFGLKNRTT